MVSLGNMALLLQVLVSILVLAVPCFYMGGTLPAAAAIAQKEEDPNRQATAWLYGLTIAGAVSGAFLVNFYLLELLGNTLTLLLALTYSWLR